MMENPAKSLVSPDQTNRTVPECVDEIPTARVDDEVASECNIAWTKPLSGRIYYHPIDDDPEFLGCTKLVIPVERVQAIYPKGNLQLSCEPMEKITTFQTQFGKAPPLDFQGIQKRIRKYEPPTVPIASDTEYRKIYYAKPIDPAKMIIPERQKPLEGEMEKISSYKRTFKGYDCDQMKYSKPINYAPKKKKTDHPEFKGSSTTKDTYKGHFSVARREPILPVRGAMAGIMTSSVSLNYETTQRREFIPKSTPRTLPSRSKYDADPYLIRSEKADTKFPITSMKQMYVPYHKVIPVCAIRPKRLPVHIDVPMSSDTSYAEHFWQRKPEKQFQRPEWSLRKPYKAPSEVMEKDTSYDMQFKKPPPTAKTESLRPKRVPLQFGTSDVVAKETTTQSQFRTPPKGDFKGHSFMPRRVYIKSDDHVDYLTTTQNAFRGLTAPRRKPIEVSRLAELQMRYKDKRIANRTLYREMFGVDFVFLPSKSPPVQRKQRCMYDFKSSEKIDPMNTNEMTQPIAQQVEVT